MEFRETTLLFCSLIVLSVSVCNAAVTMESGEKEPNCVDIRFTQLKACFDPLTTKLVSEAPADVNNFLCGAVKPQLECIIQEFNKCQDFKDQDFLSKLKHDKGGFHAKDLFYVKSADEFCKCAPTNKYLEKIEVDNLGVDVTETAWSRIANPDYICGIGREHIRTVAKALPSCMDYLQYKHDATLDEDMPYFGVETIMYAETFAENRCKNWPDDKQFHKCSEDRAVWHALKDCVDTARLYRDEDDQECGLRICIEKNMHTCPKDDQGYYIDSINVFADVKVKTKKCSTSGSPSVLATVFTILMTLCVSLYL